MSAPTNREAAALAVERVRAHRHGAPEGLAPAQIAEQAAARAHVRTDRRTYRQERDHA